MTKRRVRPGHSKHLPEGRRQKRPGRLIGDVKQPAFDKIKKGKEIRKEKRKAKKLRKEVKRKRMSWKVTGKRERINLERLKARIKKDTGKKKKPPTKAVRPVINVLIEEAELTRQWASVAKALVREGLMKVEETTDLRKKMFETLLEINPRAAKLFRSGINVFLPRGKMPMEKRLKMLSTKERMLVKDAKGRSVRAIKKPGGGSKKPISPDWYY